eukprot:1136764-Pelagomonas_calceolata.AAC.6
MSIPSFKQPPKALPAGFADGNSKLINHCPCIWPTGTSALPGSDQARLKGFMMRPGLPARQEIFNASGHKGNTGRN